MIDQLEKISAELEGIAKEFLPHNGTDNNLNLFGAISLAVDQVNYAMQILHKRRAAVPVPVSVPAPVLIPDMAADGDWCNSCDNQIGSCTCR